MNVTLSSPCACLIVAAAGTASFRDLVPWLLALVVLVVIGGIGIYAAKRLLLPGEESVPEGFTLQSLRDLHAAGELSDEEFARAKAAMIGQVKKAAESASPVGDTDEAPESQTADKSVRERGTGAE